MSSIKNIPNDNSKKEEKEKKNFNVNKNGSDRIFNPFEEPMVSLFENIFSTEPIREVSLHKFLHTSKFKAEVEKYRTCTDDKLRKKIKGRLICVTPSGSFCQRRESGLIRHTGLLCVDIDFKDNLDIDLQRSKHIIGQHCPSLYYAGLSLSGKGIFIIFRISNPKFHKQHFEALALFLKNKFGLQVDNNVKSPVSLRVVSYDPNPYYNPNPIPFQYTIETDKKSGHVIRTTAEKAKILERVEQAVAIIKEKRIDITNQYANWFKIGCALAYEFGEEGRYWFHVISRMYERYDEGDCDIQYQRCVKYKKEDGAKIGTFFYICRHYGIKV